MRIIKKLSILFVFFACVTSLAFAAGENDQTKINKFKADVAEIGLDVAITEALKQGLDVSAIAQAAISMGQTPETVTQGVMSASRSLNMSTASAVTGLASAGVPLPTIATVSLNLGYTPQAVCQSVLTAASTLNINPNTAIVSLSQAGVTPSVIAQVSGNTTDQVNSIVSSSGQTPQQNQGNNNPQGQIDQGLGFGNDPGLGGQGPNPANPPGNGGQIGGGGSLGGGGQQPVSPSRP